MSNIFKKLKGVIFDKPIIQINGDGEVLAEGCGCVTVCTDEKIVFRSYTRIEINGRGLVLTNLGCGYVSISGEITDMKFGEKK